MRLGLYGGSFDPIHDGHILPVLEAKRRLDLERVIYLPTARPPHKPDRAMAPAHARFAMVELALLRHPDLVVSDLELTAGRSSYTVDSVEYFATANSDAALYLIIGGDSFLELTSWHRWRELVSRCHLAVLTRPGWDVGRIRGDLAPELSELVESGRARFVENPTVDVSSTRLRELFAKSEPIPEQMVPSLVVEYVKKYSLYS